MLILPQMRHIFTYIANDEQRTVSVEEGEGDTFNVEIDGESLSVDVREVAPGRYHLLQEDEGHNVLVEQRSPPVLHRGGERIPVELLDEHRAARMALSAFSQKAQEGGNAIQAPMPGKVVKILVAEGDKVTSGQGIIVIEAMKMENELRAAIDGTIKEIRPAEGENVDSGEDLVFIE